MNLEDMMGLFGPSNATGAQGLGGAVDDRDPRRRRAGLDSGFGGIAGGEVTLASILPHLQGLRAYDYSGPNIRGLADLIPGMGQFQNMQGPVKRHLERQGGDFSLPPGLADMPDLPPGIDNRQAIAGGNIAPGNLDNGLALGQPPGLPAQAQGQAAPHSQAWRNVAPGYSAAAQLGYGTPEFEARLRGVGQFGQPSALTGGPEQRGPGAGGGQAAGGGGAAKSTGGGPTPVKAGGPAEAAPAAGGGVGKPGATAGGGGGKPGAPSSKQISAKKGTGVTAKPGLSNETVPTNPEAWGGANTATGIPKAPPKGKGGAGPSYKGGAKGGEGPSKPGKGGTSPKTGSGSKYSPTFSPVAVSGGQQLNNPSVPGKEAGPVTVAGKKTTDTSNSGAGQPIPATPLAKKGSTKPKNSGAQFAQNKGI